MSFRGLLLALGAATLVAFTAGCAEQRTPLELVDSPSVAQQNNAREGPMSSIVIAQGGGPTAVINQTLCGAIMSARRHDPSLRILGARYGVRGLTAGDVIDLTTMGEVQLRRLGNTPNSALGSTRDKPDARRARTFWRRSESSTPSP